MDSTKLGNKLTELNDLYCALCKNFLNIPIMFFEERGNICGRCFSKNNNVNLKRNKALEHIIQYLEVPCRYKSEGCTVKLIHSEMECHEDFCPHRQYSCPAKDTCFWQGSVVNLAKHFENFHPHILIKSDTLNFEFEINLTEDFSKHILLLANCETFLMQLCIQNEILWCTVCYIGDEDRANFEFFIEEIGYKSSFYFRNDTKKAILPQSFMQELDKDRAIQIDLAPLKIYFTNVSTLLAKLRIIGGDVTEEIDENLLSYLECPVCNMYMLPPIHQCLTGHNLCCKCRPKLAQCPTCRGRIENTRNYALEAVSAKTKYPCMNRIYGCNIILPGSYIEKHENECKMRTYGCIVQSSSCTWQGKHSDLLAHLTSVHKISNNYQTKMNYNATQFYVYTTNFDFLIAYGQIFKIGHKYENNAQTTFWNCRVYGIQNKSKFKYKITYSNDMGDFLLIKSGLCLPYTNDEEFFNHNLSFPQSLSTRVGNTVKCEIIQL